MVSKMLRHFLAAMLSVLSIASLSGCAALGFAPALTATPTRAPCQPSPLQKSKIDFAEIQGTMSTDGELWALLFFEKAHAGEDLKIAWRMTGTGGPFKVSARQDDGTVAAPIWGPELHGGSNWQHAGDEWGTGFNLPKPGCWILTATLGTSSGEIRLDVLAP